MFGTALSQLRYGMSILLNRRIRPQDLERIARDLVATLGEFGAPGADSALLPGQAAGIDPEVRRTVTRRSLRATARTAARHTAYYRRLFGDLGLDPDALDPDDGTWARVPVTPKHALRGLPGAFVSTAARPALMALTTGTSGTPTAVWYSRAELDTTLALSTISAVLGMGLRPHHTLAYAGCSRATLPLLNAEESTTRVGASFVQFGTLEPALALDRLAAPLGLPGKAPQITHLSTAASYLAALVHRAEHDGWRPADFGLESIGVGGEVLSRPLRERAEAVFGARVATSYLMTETLPSGGTPCAQGHLHHTTEFGHLEVLDPRTWEPTPPGGTGVVVHTPYVPYRECTLLLRYATGDLVRLPAAAPDCELAHLPATSEILGRWSGPLSAAVTTRDLLDLVEAEPEVPLPARYALTERPDGGAELHLLVRALPARALRARLEERIAAAGLPLTGLVLYDDRTALPPTAPLRADLREHTFETAPSPPGAGTVGAVGATGSGAGDGDGAGVSVALAGTALGVRAPAAAGGAPTATGTAPAPAGAGLAPAGTVPASAGTAPASAGTGTASAGGVPAPAGTATPPVRTVPTPAATGPASAGAAPTSAGTAPMSAGAAPTSAGTAPTPAGTVPAPARTAPAPAGAMASSDGAAAVVSVDDEGSRS
ncbi:phenylacetate--CoA ligase family protein [Streptomyces sennicomposti]|uniref:phenylacetate--CoA ligase family protein n=1 Tax=Streptomyces sennicomposti TaxID=2873384 RepID=UPI0024947399|nr:phenylacetate--CoA ligase family protein [Streptomyces sennicomposti]